LVDFGRSFGTNRGGLMGLKKRAGRREEGATLLYSVRKRDGAYQALDRVTGKVYCRHTTKESAERQRRLLEASGTDGTDCYEGLNDPDPRSTH
jgi:hypothetical protein